MLKNIKVTKGQRICQQPQTMDSVINMEALTHEKMLSLTGKKGTQEKDKAPLSFHDWHAFQRLLMLGLISASGHWHWQPPLPGTVFLLWVFTKVAPSLPLNLYGNVSFSIKIYPDSPNLKILPLTLPLTLVFLNLLTLAALIFLVIIFLYHQLFLPTSLGPSQC